MDITPELHESAPLISRYGGGGFVIAGERWEGSVCVTATHAANLALDSIASLEEAHLSLIMEADPLPEIILFGGGAQAALIPASLRQALDTRQIAYDMMDTGAACRTFNILLAEDRRVAAVLMAV